MTQRKWTWFERKFNFDFPAEKMPDILERLRGTPARAQVLVEDLDLERLQVREQEGTWSIKENIAHIADLEPLWFGRIEDIIGGQETMRPADLTNRTTMEANHHESSIGQILERVSNERSKLVERIETLSSDQWAASSLHPRLKTPMRIVDLCYFVADHDDYHLARCRYLLGI